MFLPAIFLLNVKESTKLVKYADDLSLVVPFKSNDHAAINQCISEELAHLESLCVRKQLQLNINKSNVMIHSRTTLTFKSSLPLPMVDVTRILGVHLTKELTWNIHSEAICKKCESAFPLSSTTEANHNTRGVAFDLHYLYQISAGICMSCVRWYK